MSDDGDAMTAANQPTRQRYARGEGERLRVDLLEAAADLMAEHGNVAEVSLRKVAKRAGVSPTAVYRHFSDHEELLQASVLYCWQNFYDALKDARSTVDDPYLRLAAAGRAYLEFALANPGQYRVLFSNSLHVELPESVDEDGGPGFAAFQLLVDLVAAILQANEDGRDPFFVAVQVHTWIHGIVHLCGNHTEIPWPAAEDLLSGLTAALRLDAINAAGDADDRNISVRP